MAGFRTRKDGRVFPTERGGSGSIITPVLTNVSFTKAMAARIARDVRREGDVVEVKKLVDNDGRTRWGVFRREV